MKVLASDYDGTLKINGEVNTDVLKAIRAWRTKGNAFGIVTGRSFQTMKTELEEYQIPVDFVVCNNGGVILNHQFSLMEMNVIPFEVGLDIIQFIEASECNGYAVNDGHHRARKQLRDVENKHFHITQETISMDELLQSKTIAQIVIAVNGDEMAQRMASELSAQFGEFIEAYVNVNCVDIVPKGISKETGLQYIVDYYQYPQSEVYTIGDSYNDLCMLQAYHGATLHHAVEDIKSQVDCVVANVGERIKLLMEL